MIAISVEDINSRAPLEVFYAPKDGSFNFVTRKGRKYTIGFVKEELLPYPGIYQFFIRSENHRSKDGDLFATIVAIIEAYFATGALALTYVCDIRDGRQCARSRLFNHWFRNYPLKDEYTFRTSKIVVEDTEYHIAIIVRNDNPLSVSAVTDYTNLIAELCSEDKLN